jgi:ATP-dependent DNA helicase RecG
LAKVSPTKTKTTSLAEKLASIGLRADWDFALHLPIRYEDETRITRVRDARVGIDCQVEVEIIHTEITYRPRRQLVVQAKDGDTLLYLRFLNFYGSQVKQLAIGKRLRLFGEVRQGFFGAEMVHPRYRIVTADESVPEALTPVYSTTAGVSQVSIRRVIERALDALSGRQEFADCVPEKIRRQLHLQPFQDSVLSLHRPSPAAMLNQLADRTDPAWRRIKFDELLSQQLAMKKARAARDAKTAPQMVARGHLAEQFLAALPFGLTDAQMRAAKEITEDLTKPHPMQRLLQGDVGSGKTVVAALAAAQAIECGYQVAMMAPTEILAEQHYRKLSSLLAPLGVVVTWLTGSLKAKEKREAIAAIASGDTQLAIGTHALFQDGVTFANLGLAIIDEQHRFGVGQRLALREKASVVEEAHQLMMSATPIPRTLSMSYFADLDVSVIDELPPGRTPISTRLLADSRRDELLERIRAACLHGGQAYWVCPLIEESEKLQLQTAVDTFNRIKEEFPDLNVGLVHGRLKPLEKNAVMQQFINNEIQLLVATTVIEVGVDVPNATIMVIEHAERMGLSQLHQLRGRVGRGAKQSACILLYQSPLGETARTRLKVIYETTDGFEIARQDLLIRGPGEHLGARQSGAPLLRFADIERDIDLLDAARDAATWMLEYDTANAEKHLARWLGSRQHYLKA